MYQIILKRLSDIRDSHNSPRQRVLDIAFKVSAYLVSHFNGGLLAKKNSVRNMMSEQVIRIWFRRAGVPFFDNYIRPYRRFFIGALYNRDFSRIPGWEIMLSWVGRAYYREAPTVKMLRPIVGKSR